MLGGVNRHLYKEQKKINIKNKNILDIQKIAWDNRFPDAVAYRGFSKGRDHTNIMIYAEWKNIFK